MPGTRPAATSFGTVASTTDKSPDDFVLASSALARTFATPLSGFRIADGSYTWPANAAGSVVNPPVGPLKCRFPPVSTYSMDNSCPPNETFAVPFESPAAVRSPSASFTGTSGSSPSTLMVKWTLLTERIDSADLESNVAPSGRSPPDVQLVSRASAQTNNQRADMR